MTTYNRQPQVLRLRYPLDAGNFAQDERLIMCAGNFAQDDGKNRQRHKQKQNAGILRSAQNDKRRQTTAMAAARGLHPTHRDVAAMDGAPRRYSEMEG